MLYMYYLIKPSKHAYQGNSLAVQWLRFRASTAGNTGLNPGQGTKILQATWHGQKHKQNHHQQKHAFQVGTIITLILYKRKLETVSIHQRPWNMHFKQATQVNCDANSHCITFLSTDTPKVAFHIGKVSAIPTAVYKIRFIFSPISI